MAPAVGSITGYLNPCVNPADFDAKAVMQEHCTTDGGTDEDTCGSNGCAYTDSEGDECQCDTRELCVALCKLTSSDEDQNLCQDAWEKRICETPIVENWAFAFGKNNCDDVMVPFDNARNLMNWWGGACCKGGKQLCQEEK